MSDASQPWGDRVIVLPGCHDASASACTGRIAAA
jgi:hypothetical protein